MWFSWLAALDPASRAAPHVGLSPTASLAQTAVGKPGLSIKRTHFSTCDQLCHELHLCNRRLLCWGKSKAELKVRLGWWCIGCSFHAPRAIAYITKQLSVFKIPIAFWRCICLGVSHLKRCLFYCTLQPNNFTILNTLRCFRKILVIFVEKQRQSFQLQAEYLFNTKLLLRLNLGFMQV